MEAVLFESCGNTISVFHFTESDLQDNTRYILLRPPVFGDTDSEGFQYYSVTGGSADTASLKRAIILMQSPINPEETIGDGVLSLLISKNPSDIDSRVVKTSTILQQELKVPPNMGVQKRRSGLS